MDRHLIIRAFEKFPGIKALVIGDVMIDSYYFGSVDRISPEAPVPVVSVKSKENRLGGAANVALNLKALGAVPVLCAVTGNDANGDLFGQLMNKSGLASDGIVRLDNRPTTVKTRIISHSQQILRIDEESDSVIENEDRDALATRIEKIIGKGGVDVVIFEDYDKGVISEDLIEKVVGWCKPKGIPVTVDPKKRNFAKYRNVTLFKPNLKELREGLNIDIDPVNTNTLATAYQKLQRILGVEKVLITLSEKGMYYADREVSKWIPAHVRNIADVSGAGDTVISVISLCLAAGLDPVFSTKLANLAGGLVCEKVGVVPIDGQQLEDEAMRLSK